MPEVKICGIRTSQDIAFINKYLPEYAGFVFAESKRRVTPDEVRIITAELNKRVKKVGVFVNEALKSLVDITSRCGLDVVQLHGDETPEELNEIRNALMPFGTQLWKCIRVKDKESLKLLYEYNADAYVLDAYVKDCYGGAGQVFDWKTVCNIKKNIPIILAGGLNIENVREAVKTVRPFAVDVSSGVETNGWKDEIKIRDFILAARSFNNQEEIQ